MSTTSQTRSTAYAVMRRIFDEGFATGDGSVADEFCSPDLLDHQFGTAGRGADAIAHVKDRQCRPRPTRPILAAVAASAPFRAPAA